PSSTCSSSSCAAWARGATEDLGGDGRVVTLRRLLSLFFTVAGVVLIGVAALHSARGVRGQSEGRKAFERQLAGGYTPVAQSVERREDLPRGSAVPAAAGYPFGQPIARKIGRASCRERGERAGGAGA